MPNIVCTQHNQKISAVLGDKKIGKSIYNIFYGIELEYEVKTPPGFDKGERTNLREQVGRKLHPTTKDFAFMKHDGSLKNGFEVVSLPMSLDSHRNKWSSFFRMVKKTDLEVRSTCGMHVHVSRELLTQFQIGKIIIFLYSPQNNAFIRQIAGRIPPKQFAELNAKKLKDVKNHHNRYSALNLTNPETIEFRLFRGTFNKEEVLKNIEFCDALVRFTWPSRTSYAQLVKNGAEVFCSFVESNKKMYPELYKFLVQSKNIKKKKTLKRVLKKKLEKEKNSSLVSFLTPKPIAELI